MLQLPKDLTAEVVVRWQAVVEAFERDGLPLPAPSAELSEVQKALVFSDFVTRQLARQPHILSDLMASGDLKRVDEPQGAKIRLSAVWQQQFRQTLPQWPFGQAPDGGAPANLTKEALMQVLRIFRNREMVRIALRDICGWADLNQTLADLSTLADTTIAAALDGLYTLETLEWGLPVDAGGRAIHLVVLGLGKLGAGELNFSSDVDLMFAYAADGLTRGGQRGSTSHEEFFTRLCRALIQAIGTTTVDGFVFRVDTRLRPFGDAGPLVMTFDRLEDYYQEQGREWERYALIKARVVAGDAHRGQELLARLKPFVFRRYLDYGAFDSLREMKGRITLEVRSKGLEDNIKLGSGGIREIEFFGQMFQLIRGGVESALQIRPIRQVLAVLVKKGFIAAATGQAMDAAYLFLRTVENRVQQWADQQTHLLPADSLARLRLAAALGFGGWDAFKAQLNLHRHKVHAHFDELLAPAKEKANGDSRIEPLKQLEGLWQGVMEPAKAQSLIRHLGYQAPSEVLHQIKALREDHHVLTMSAAGRERLNRLVPMVMLSVAKAPQPDLILARIFDLIRGIQQRTSYLALLVENPSTLTHLVQLAGASPWIATFLSRHPVLLDELMDPRTLFRPPRRTELAQELNQRLEGIDPEDLEYQMESMRVFKQVNVLRVAASDITDVLPLMKVSDHLSDIAEVVVETTVNLCFQQLKKKYGVPTCSLTGGDCERGFAVIAYGKLGGLELGYGSDLDLVFLHAAEPGNTTGAERNLDNAQFFARLGQRVLHLLTTHTPAGVLYEVDMRLRPSGASGMLVSHVEGFAEYQRREAWTWEHQALIRARAIVGDPVLQARFTAIREEILTRPRDAEKLRQEVAAMRERLRKEQKSETRGRFDLKQGVGGIIDIEFLVQYLVLRHAHRHPAIVRWTDNVRQLQALNEAGILDNVTAFRLRRAFLIYRATAHRLNLAQQPARVADNRFLQARQFVAEMWQRLLGSSHPGKGAGSNSAST
ncbi:MAG: bifunctional [glutamate--ammonia ligase]-adenylyl-L-tyrosine phosphorylase/[glutamate--ammonia-ligase] adenylyltransferase [Desulfobacteraceae bacterium]|nr:bifunctional [glutamate--ammonia ligase]-adenylyl-L-tyrosine phosphorylase/[glutamate--ammonia-ligase] adenylyltransferase [Desulfobacteraceae bacterium]